MRVEDLRHFELNISEAEFNALRDVGEVSIPRKLFPINGDLKVGWLIAVRGNGEYTRERQLIAEVTTFDWPSDSSFVSLSLKKRMSHNDCVEARCVHEEIGIVRGIIYEIYGNHITLTTPNLRGYTCFAEGARIIPQEEIDQNIHLKNVYEWYVNGRIPQA